MKINSNPFEWCELLSLYQLNEYKDGARTYKELVEHIRSSANGAFDICDSAPCRHRKALLPVKDVAWDYLYQCMKISGKDFIIKLPCGIDGIFMSHVDKAKRNSVYSWYDPETEGIAVLAYTGREKEEVNIYPEFDGYGRYDTYYEVVEGVLDPSGDKWIKRPKTHFV